MTSCGNSCGPITNCGGHCTSSTCSGTYYVGCNSYCLHSNCNFNCGGNNTINSSPSPSPSNCLGLCSSSSCSATGREYNHTESDFYIIYVYILYI